MRVIVKSCVFKASVVSLAIMTILMTFITTSAGEKGPEKPSVWARHFENPDGNPVRLLQSPDGGIYILVMHQNKFGGWDISVIKTDSGGTKLWGHTLERSDDGGKFDWCPTPDGGVIVSWFQVKDAKGEDKHSHFFTRIDNDGKATDRETPILMKEEAVVANGLYLTGAITRSRSGGYITGIQSYPAGRKFPIRSWYLALAKVDDDLNVEWRKDYPVEGMAMDVFEISDQEYIVSVADYEENLWVIKVTSTGEVKWKTRTGMATGADDGLWPRTYMDREGNIYTVGFSRETTGASKVDSSGKVVWSMEKPMGQNIFTSLAINGDKVVIAGALMEEGSGQKKTSGALFRCNADGEIEKGIRYPSMYITDIAPASGGGFLAAMKKESGWTLMSLDASGNCDGCVF